ncbi:DgyrCDS1087 [Dimorphilus gyrociliatus]|uniref:DgyrCDS1087 n=1 Tax=Dimorphilus gyrociliatus TaxID=2664684 RepID=A0A7I8V9C7_9ANNE|nr:DgyrCDS1087 [Dimorphilus gyrociliatus]
MKPHEKEKKFKPLTARILDIDDLIRSYVKKYDFSPEHRKLANLEVKKEDVSFKYFRLVHDKICYPDKDDITQKSGFKVLPDKVTLCTASFKNDTGSPQIFHFNAERKTKSITKVSTDEMYKFEMHSELKFPILPGMGMEANVGMRGEWNLTENYEETVEEEFTWSVNSDVKVPENTETIASLEIVENQFEGQWKLKTYFKGRISIAVKNKNKPDEVVTTITFPVAHFVQLGGKYFQEDDKGIYFTSTGWCKSRFATDQQVNLKQSKLPATSAVQM